MIKLVKLNNGGPLVIGEFHSGKEAITVKSAVSILSEDGIMRMTDLLPFSDFEKGITFYKTSVEFISKPTTELVAEYEAFCEDIGMDIKVEAYAKSQLLVEGNDTPI